MRPILIFLALLFASPVEAAQWFPTFSGDVTNAGPGSPLLTIANGAVTAAKMATGAAAGNLGFTPLNPANNLSDLLSPSTARTNLGLGGLSTQSSLNLSSQATGTLQAAQAPALTGDVTTTAGALATTISSGAVTAAKMATGAAAGNLGFTPAKSGANSDITSLTLTGITFGTSLYPNYTASGTHYDATSQLLVNTIGAKQALDIL